MINLTTVKVVGYWNNFNITWNPVVEVTYGNVIYEIKVDNVYKNGTAVTTTDNSIKYWDKVPPFSTLSVWLRAFTYWGTSQQIEVEIRSPPSVPSAPQNLRSFVSHIRDTNRKNIIPLVTVLLRWDDPVSTNGLLRGYKIDCWLVNDDHNINYCGYITTTKEKEIQDLYFNRTYLFQVQAFTEVGEGKPSIKLIVNTIRENPLPLLLTTNTDTMSLYDADNGQIDYLLHGMSKPIDIRYIYAENKIIWLNEFQELLIYSLAYKNKTKILDVHSNSTVFTVDWLERSLYYVQINDITKESFVYKIDFNRYEKLAGKQEYILKTSGVIANIEVCPFER